MNKWLLDSSNQSNFVNDMKEITLCDHMQLCFINTIKSFAILH